MPDFYNGQRVQAVRSVDASGNLAPAGSSTDPLSINNAQNVYTLASAASLASAGTTTPVTGIIGGSYIWNVVGTFSGGSTVALQALGSDGTTWITIGSAVSASGNVGVVLGNNATVRLLGAVATTTALSSSLS